MVLLYLVDNYKMAKKASKTPIAVQQVDPVIISLENKIVVRLCYCGICRNLERMKESGFIPITQ
jgi:hypothetical protein